ncbi:hypothetical protein KUV89_01835 [Marinobacter hydrocarbonoclasticus]|nr:hypothetical protein [Marinobacter nauticus]
MSNRFFLLDTDGESFEGMVTSDGPHLKSPIGESLAVGETYLGLDFPGHAGWWAFDHRHQLALTSLSPNGIQTVIDAFGLPVRPNPLSPVPDTGFWKSPAFQGLCEWVRHHHTRAEHLIKRHPQRPPYWLAMCEAAISIQDDDN